MPSYSNLIQSIGEIFSRSNDHEPVTATEVTMTSSTRDSGSIPLTPGGLESALRSLDYSVNTHLTGPGVAYAFNPDSRTYVMTGNIQYGTVYQATDLASDQSPRHKVPQRDKKKIKEFRKLLHQSGDA